MKGSVGTSTAVYHTRLPHQRKLMRMAKVADPSGEAGTRLARIGHWKKHKKASVTCRRFGISRSTLCKWPKRCIEKGPRGLESLSRPPKRRRVSSVPRQAARAIVELKEKASRLGLSTAA